jgi:glycosyltransferase involved in cell wall biosynthesis
VNLLCDGIIFELQTHGGISRLYREILPRLCEQDGELAVTLFEGTRPLQQRPSHERIGARVLPGLGTTLFPARVSGRHFFETREISLGLAARGGRDAVWHSTYFTRPLGWRGASVVLVCDLIYETYSALFNSWPEEKLRRRMRARTLEADHVICISEATRRDVHERYGVPLERTSVMHLASTMSAGDFSGAGAMLPEAMYFDRPYILYVGQRWHYKNFSGLLQAYGGWSRNREVGLLCTGGSSEWSAEERQLLERYGVQDLVTNLGWVDDATLAGLYRDSRFFILPSLAEGFGLPVLEAMRCGTLALLSRASSLPEVGGAHALYFDPDSLDEMRQRMDEALAMGEEERGRRIEAARAWAATFTWNRAAGQMLKILHEVAGE